MDDLERVIKTIPKEHLFIYGHSFGGNVLANFLLAKTTKISKWSCFISAWLELAKQPNMLEFAMANVMNKIVPGLRKIVK